MTEEPIVAVDFYTRRGCGFSMMLDRALARAGVPVHKHDIWADPDAAAIVRGWAHGSETVPTVVVGDVGLVNPTADKVVAVLSEKAPHLVPEGWEPSEPRAAGRLLRRVLGD